MSLEAKNNIQLKAVEQGDNFDKLHDEFYDPGHIRSIAMPQDDENFVMVFEFMLKINEIRVEAGSWIK